MPLNAWILFLVYLFPALGLLYAGIVRRRVYLRDMLIPLGISGMYFWIAAVMPSIEEARIVARQVFLFTGGIWNAIVFEIIFPGLTMRKYEQ